MLRDVMLGVNNLRIVPWFIRIKILKSVGINFGENSFIDTPNELSIAPVRIGSRTFINTGFRTNGEGEVMIGNDVSIGPGVTIITSTHDITSNPKKRASLKLKSQPVHIEDGVWLGAGCIILPGCAIREGCVIGAGAVITTTTEANGLYMGIPAKLIRVLPVEI
ncbi:acyltransferase [Sphingomonas abietis]|uniref:Acyltransferase n=1 Tax=Sphingomonas abietis TaxID=3012344 RepID=A0ABY7NLQ4_9SPHN|nr:acyltransferase [Sphingomonas abietis]WBO20849.1 acyltransferase [Sphingomonas abietis]